MDLQILYDTRDGSGTTQSFAERLAETLGLRAYNINMVDFVQDDYILCTYTYGLGELPVTTSRFLKTGNNGKYIKGVVGNGSSNFKSMGLFAVVGDRISESYNVPLYKKLDMGGTNEDVYEVAMRINHQFNMGLNIDKSKFKPESTFIDGKFKFKQRKLA